jgi:hypothetical protein
VIYTYNEYDLGFERDILTCATRMNFEDITHNEISQSQKDK